MAGVGLGLGRFGFVLLPLGETLTVAIQPHGDGQGEDFGRGPERMSDDQAKDNPIVSPTDERFGSAGDKKLSENAVLRSTSSAVVAKPERMLPRKLVLG